MTEKELILALKRGDVFALEATIGKYAGYVMAVVQHTLGRSASEEDKEELVSDTFITLWEKASTLDDNSNLKSWLAVVSRNASLNKLRTIRPTEELQEDTIFTDDSIRSNSKVNYYLFKIDFFIKHLRVKSFGC